VGRRTYERLRPWLGTCLLCSAFFIDVMGSTSVFTAAPAIGRGLGLSPVGLQWSIIAATLPGGALLLVGGRLADRFGRRRVFMTGLGLLVLSSAACGVASSAAVLICARIGQGVSGALLIPSALSLIIAMFADDADRNKALATWSAIGGIGATAGLLLGGLVTTGLGWQWVFLVNVPVGLAMLALCPLLLDEAPGQDGPEELDVAGIVTMTLGLALLIYGTSQVPSLGWRDWRTTGGVLAGGLLLLSFVRVERTSDAPIVPPRLLGSRVRAAGNATLFVAGMCVDGLLFTLTLYTQRGQGYSALRFGAMTAVMTICSVVAAWIAQRAITSVGTRLVAAGGLALLCGTCIIFAWAVTAASTGLLVGGMVVFGFGMGCAFVAGSVASLEDVAEPDAGVAAALQTIAFGIGTALGVATLATVAAATAGSPASGSRAAFLGGVVIAAVGFAVTVALSARRPSAAAGRVPRATSNL
jgi:MFS family permease